MDGQKNMWCNDISHDPKQSFHPFTLQSALNENSMQVYTI